MFRCTLAIAAGACLVAFSIVGSVIAAGDKDKAAASRTSEDKARAHIENVTKEVLASRGRTMVVTSAHRDDSEAHKRGAIDIRSKELPSEKRHEEAKAISKKLGADHTVIVEEVNHEKKHQTNTSYRNGEHVATHRNQPVRASETHTHIQPDRH